jgi:hypothetical protein
MKIFMLGRDRIGAGLAAIWSRAGHEVITLGHDGGDGSAADVILVAVPGSAIAAASANVTGIAGKMTIDSANAYGNAPPSSRRRRTRSSPSPVARLPRARATCSLPTRTLSRLPRDSSSTPASIRSSSGTWSMPACWRTIFHLSKPSPPPGSDPSSIVWRAQANSDQHHHRVAAAPQFPSRPAPKEFVQDRMSSGRRRKA